MISNYFSDICGGNGYIRLLSNVCVKLSRVNCTLQEAVSYCSSDNATLFHIGTSDKYYSIIYLIKSMSGTFVIQDFNILLFSSFFLIFFTFHGQVYSIQSDEIKCVSNLRNVTGFLCVLIFSLSMARCTWYNLMMQSDSDLLKVTGFLCVSRFPAPFNLTVKITATLC
jgi:hypothetical protein